MHVLRPAGGERPIPTNLPGKVVNVKNLGAKGNGRSLDDKAVQVIVAGVLHAASRAAGHSPCPPKSPAPQAALRRAINNQGGVVYFPRGTYLLSKPLYANVSNIVIRGAGRLKTRIIFTKSLAQIYTQWGVDACTGELQLTAGNSKATATGEAQEEEGAFRAPPGQGHLLGRASLPHTYCGAGRR